MALNFHIAMSGIRVAESLITTAQNNIANAKNLSYAKQAVDVSVPGYVLGRGLQAQIGNGAIVEQISRVTDELITHQNRSEIGKLNRYGSINSVLGSVEVAFNDIGEDGIFRLTQDFFTSFEEASKFPEQSSYRVNIITSAETLASKIKEVTENLDNVKNQTDSKIQTEIAKTNDLIRKIGDINKQIQNTFSESPNGLLDERDKYLDELAQFIDIEVVHKDSVGNMEVKSGNVTLISGKETYEIKGNFDSKNDEWVLGVGNIELNLKDGSLSGLVDIRNNTIDDYLTTLNQFTSGLITEINAVHRSGFGLDGTTNTDFFLGSDIRTIKVNDDLKKDPQKIGLSSELGVSGNSDIADQLFELQESAFLNGKTPTDFYQEFVVQMANIFQSSTENESVHRNVQQLMEGQRQSVQGVNIDEELINMTDFQQFYQANAKMLQANQKLLDSIISII